MGNTRSFEHSSIDWLAKEPLAPHIDAYMLYLANRGYVTVNPATYFQPTCRSDRDQISVDYRRSVSSIAWG